MNTQDEEAMSAVLADEGLCRTGFALMLIREI